MYFVSKPNFLFVYFVFSFRVFRGKNMIRYFPMPIYEFYCTPCNTLFNFFARKVDTKTLPPCPKCGVALSRAVSQVAYVQGGGDGGDDGLGDVRLDESRMDKALENIGGDIDSLGDSADMMQKFSEASGLKFNKDIRDALERISSGENPDSVSQDLDEILASGTEAFAPDKSRRHTPPQKDATLYDL